MDRRACPCGQQLIHYVPSRVLRIGMCIYASKGCLLKQRWTVRNDVIGWCVLSDSAGLHGSAALNGSAGLHGVLNSARDWRVFRGTNIINVALVGTRWWTRIPVFKFQPFPFYSTWFRHYWRNRGFKALSDYSMATARFALALYRFQDSHLTLVRSNDIRIDSWSRLLCNFIIRGADFSQ